MGLASMRIATRLALGFGLMALLIVLIGATALFKASAIDTEFRSVTDERMPRVEVLKEFTLQIAETLDLDKMLNSKNKFKAIKKEIIQVILVGLVPPLLL